MQLESEDLNSSLLYNSCARNSYSFSSSLSLQVESEDSSALDLEEQLTVLYWEARLVPCSEMISTSYWLVIRVLHLRVNSYLDLALQ